MEQTDPSEDNLVSHAEKELGYQRDGERDSREEWET